MLYVRQKVTVEEARKGDRVNSETAKNKALIEYIAMMSDVEIPITDDTPQGGLIENE